MDEFATRLVRVEQMLEEVLRFVRPKKTRKDYQAKYYQDQRTKRKSQLKRLKNRDRNNLNPDPRLQKVFAEWAAVGFTFACPYRFLEWLSFTWNAETYEERPITRSGGYYRVMSGFSGNRPSRYKRTENDLFGCGRKRLAFSGVTQIQFRDAEWWNWGFGVLGKTVREMQEDSRWAELPESFTKPLRLLMGGGGMVEVRPGLFFDQNEPNCEILAKTYALVKPQIDRAWRACKLGLFAKTAPSPCHQNLKPKGSPALKTAPAPAISRPALRSNSPK